jgi:hypothetical protein
MTITEYLDSVKERLLTDENVSTFRITRERDTLTDGYMRARVTLADGSQLEFSEYVQLVSDDQITVVTYSYHWSDAQGNLIRRWDNTPHFPDLANFPHHVHDGPSGSVRPGQPTSILTVLDEIGKGLV